VKITGTIPGITTGIGTVGNGEQQNRAITELMNWMLPGGHLMLNILNLLMCKVQNATLKTTGGNKTYGGDRGTVIYGTDGSAFINRDGYKVFDRNGKLVSDNKSDGDESGIALGGGGSMTDAHVLNFFDAIRGKTNELNSPIEMGAKSQMLTHYANIAYRIKKPFQVDSETGRIFDRDAMKLWSREYEKGWEPKI
jgi:hypothetical protein